MLTSEKVPAALYDRLTDTPTYASSNVQSPVNVRASCSGEVSQRQAGSRLGERVSEDGFWHDLWVV